MNIEAEQQISENFEEEGFEEKLTSKIFAHMDLDCFYVAVEAKDNPKYRGKPIIIGADPKEGKGRGVVCTCSYEARKYGVHSAMPISQAYKLCPNAIYLRGDFRKYSQTSQDVMNILKKNLKKVNQTSIDEAYADLTNICENYTDAKEIAKNIKEEIKQNLGITCSIGVAPTKIIAKIASDYEKPDGLTIVEPKGIKAFLWNLNITKIPGIGKKTKFYYYKKNFFKIKDFYLAGKDKLIELFGKNGKWIWSIINGFEYNKLERKYSRKSVGGERTFAQDESNIKFILQNLEEINNKLHQKMEEKNLFYRTITLKIRFKGYETYTRSKTLGFYIRDPYLAFNEIKDLLKEFLPLEKEVRLIGIRFSSLGARYTNKQITLLDFL
ncbi:MAG: DNA polymerase IV [Promethearchaeota archaeon]